MNTNSVSIPREVLEAPFPPGAIKSRPGAYGGSLSYLEGHTVVQRLNDAFDGNWSFKVVTHEVLDDEVLVLGEFRAVAADVVKMAFGSSQITRNDRTGKAIALGDDLKAAATDALKKSATLLGVGLQLYGAPIGPARPGNGSRGTNSEMPAHDRHDSDDGTRQDRTSSGTKGNGGTNGNGRITNKQLSAIFSIARQRGMNNSDVRTLAKERFAKNLDYLTKVEASTVIEHLLNH